jgi:hypothetical protein
MFNIRAVLTILVLVAACLAVPSCQGEWVEVTEIERKIDPSLLVDDAGGPIESPYAEKITFSNPSVRPNPQDDDELLISLDVRNAGDKTVTHLHIWADFYNRNGVKAADEGELLAHDMRWGDNNTPIPPQSSKRGIIELDSPENWVGGKMVITIMSLETK